MMPKMMKVFKIPKKLISIRAYREFSGVSQLVKPFAILYSLLTAMIESYDWESNTFGDINK